MDLANSTISFGISNSLLLLLMPVRVRYSSCTAFRWFSTHLVRQVLWGVGDGPDAAFVVYREEVVSIFALI